MTTQAVHHKKKRPIIEMSMFPTRKDTNICKNTPSAERRESGKFLTIFWLILFLRRRQCLVELAFGA
jgi:hypothetical protein